MSSRTGSVRYRTSYQKLVDQDAIGPFTDAERARWDKSARRESSYMPMLAYIALTEVPS